MSYARQNTVAQRLGLEAVKALDALGARHFVTLYRQWGAAQRELKLAVMESYRMTAAPRERWSLSKFKARGAQARLHAQTMAIMERFRATSKQSLKRAFNDLYAQSVFRHAYILDMTTPDSRHVLIPHRDKLHEAAVRGFFLGGPPGDDWSARWDSWIDAWRDAFGHNVGLNALNEGSLEDALDEVAATQVNTPRASLDTALSRIYDFEGTYAIAQGEGDVAEMNDELMDEEVWKTRGDLRVCDDCDENEGLTAEEADGDIPMHPNCHCYWLMVPKDFAELLADGNEDDRDLAEEMLARGIVPNALVLRDDRGGIIGQAVVSFESWMEGQGLAVSTR